MRGVWWIVGLGLVVAGCQPSRPPVTAKKESLDPWKLVTTDLRADEPALLWNGRLGVRIGADRPSELGAYLIDRYEPNGEEKILLQPSPIPEIRNRNTRQLMRADRNGPYRRELDLKTGELTTEFTWNGKKVIQTVSINPARPVIGERWWIQVPPSELEFLHPTAGPNMSLAETIEPTPGSPNVSMCTSVQQFDNGPQLDYGNLFRLTEYPNCADVEIDGPVEDQLAIRSMLHYLATSISPEGRMAVSPFGLSNDLYNGHVFWDADIWVFPALALLDPERAQAIPRYRVRHLAQAADNFRAWIAANRPTGNGLLGASAAKGGLKYPWESSVTGRETVPGPSKFQDHISGDVAWMMDTAASLGLAPTADADRIRKGVGTFFEARRNLREDGFYDIRGTMSPDENHIGDNDLYTNLLAQYVAGGGKDWGKPTYALPSDHEGFLTYDGDALRGYKQAAAVLSIYPLQYPAAEQDARRMMDRFEDKVTKNGPAMSDAIHALIWARLGEADRAYDTWHRAWQPFTTSPLMLFSEKRNRPRTYFTTGAGGCLQTVLYGFLGIRLDWKKASGAAWSTNLRNGRTLSIKPNLPKSWNRITVRGLSILGRRYDVVADRTSVRVTASPDEVSE